MKFKILKGTKLFDKLVEIQKQISFCNKESFKIVKELGFEQFHKRKMVLAGGISAFHSKTKPEGYSYAYENKDKEAIFPKKNKMNEDILKRIYNLPVVTYDKINNTIKYDWRDTNDLAITTNGARKVNFAPEICWRKRYVLIGIPEYVNYKPVKDMIEITVSEFKKLSNTK